MVDWMIEVLTNFKCDDQSFFLAVSILDRYFKSKQERIPISDLHAAGVTSMFISSKYEDIIPLKMKRVYEKIAHKKLSVDKIKSLEMEILKVIKYRIPAPTSLDFLKVYLKEILSIGYTKRTKVDSNDKKISKSTLPTEEANKLLIEKMSIYLAKMALHDYDVSGKKPSL